MTTETDIIKLEAKLAAMTRPCSVKHAIRIEVREDKLKEFDAGWRNSECGCEGSGVVPLIEGSRLTNSWGTGCPKMGCMTLRSELPCDNCQGLGYVPDLSMEKVLNFMLESHAVHLGTDVEHKVTLCMWKDGDEVGATPYEALLRACIAGAEINSTEEKHGY